MQRVAAIAFDLDGTLVDSAVGITFALNAALADAGLPAVGQASVRGWVGDGPDALIVRALQAHRLPEAELQALATRMRQRFDAVTLQGPGAQGAAYAGVPELLAALAGDYPLTVVTNKPTLLARAVLNAAGLLAHFTSVHGADSAAQRKPAPLLIRQAASRLQVEAEALLMVGDGLADLQAAHAANCRCAWVSWGYGQAPAMHTDAVWRLDAPHELLARLQAAPQRAQIH